MTSKLLRMEQADPDDCISVIPVPEPHGPGPRTSLEIYLPSLFLGRKLPFLLRPASLISV